MKQRLHDRAPVYEGVRSNYRWRDHVMRLLVTAGAIAWLDPKSILDPATGDASIIKAAHRLAPLEHAHLGDVSTAQIADLWGQDFGFRCELSAGDALEFMRRHKKHDVVVLTEILEHVEEPEELLRLAREKGNYLVASSPLNETDRSNHEHLWSWTEAAYRQMLIDTGWRPMVYIPIQFSDYPYTFQLWVCG